MAKTSPLWDSAARKEAMELLDHLWVHGDEQIRDQITDALTAGPPEHLRADEAAGDAQASHDRRIYDRVGILARNRAIGLSQPLADIFRSLEKQYPEWRLPEGEQAKFSVWMGMPRDEDSDFVVADLKEIATIGDLVKLLVSTQERRNGLLETWRQFTTSEVDRALEVLESLSREIDGGPVDVWRAALWGLREVAKDSKIPEQLVELLAVAPEALYAHPDFTRALADVADAIAMGMKAPPSDSFWRLFDRALSNAKNDPQNLDVPENDEWLSIAINRSMGILATAFCNGLFAYRLKADDGIPQEHLARLDQLVGKGDPAHRLARVVAASRLPYIFAVDPEWAKASLIPSLDWTDEEEAVATWQGFTWHPTVGPDLWAIIRQPFLAAFTKERLRRLGSSTRILSQLLVLAGIEFDRDEFPREQVRSAIKAMSDQMRVEAISWLWGNISQKGAEGDPPQEERADTMWRERVQPWLARVWPKDTIYRTPALAERFALVAIATADAFEDALTFIEPLLQVTDSGLLLSQLMQTSHPENSPKSVLRLLNRTLDANGYWPKNELGGILDRVADANPDLVSDAVYRKLRDLVLLRSS